MPDKTIDPNKLRQDIIRTLKETIASYGDTVKEIRQRELKKKELCLLCGNAASASCCGVLRKDDMAAMDVANGMGGGGPMAMSELVSVSGPKVPGVKAASEKKADGAVLPGDKDPLKDNQPDEGSGGMKKDEMLAGQKAPAKAGRTVADLRARANHLHTSAGLTDVKSLSPKVKAQSSIPMGKGEKMDAQTGGRLNAIAGDRMKDIINAPKTKGTLRPKLAGMGKMVKSMVPSVQDKVNAVVGNQDPGPIPQNVKDALTPDKDKDKKDKAKTEAEKKALAGAKDKKLGKVSIEEANKELSSAKSVVGGNGPIPGMGTKVANPQAMSPGKGMPKPVSGTIGKNEDRLKEVLGKCAMCSKPEHTKKCETV